MERIRVLIADDDTLLSRKLADYIQRRGFEVHMVSTGREARQEILNWKPRR